MPLDFGENKYSEELKDDIYSLDKDNYIQDASDYSNDSVD
jgi:hypothetical protein